MTVQELIDELMKVKDKSTPVFYVHDISDYQLHREIIEKPYYVEDINGTNPEIWLITNGDFDEVESEILYVSGVLEMKGYRVVTPIDFDVNPDLDKPYHELLGNDIKALMECDAICLCPCWEKSKGCQLEHFVAQLWDKEIIEFERLKYSKIWKEK